MGRPGRPPQSLAGEVDDRILDAARTVFLEHGLAGASIDEIASIAHAGKTTIYARFPSKEALFAAVGMRNSAKVISRFESRPPAGATVEERLFSIGTGILERFLVSDVIDFMRLSIAEARRFPALAKFGRAARERAAESVAEALSQAMDSDVCPALAPDRIAATTRFFLDLVVANPLMRALTGEDLELIHAETGPHVKQSIGFFLAACRREQAAQMKAS
jgi:AcrR family transcriptional regulator